MQEPQPTRLSQRAMLATLSISFWRASKLDRKASREICAEKHTDERAARVHKSLLPEDAPEYAAVDRLVGALYAEFRKQTLPWGEGGAGARILPAANYLPLGDAIRPLRLDFEAAVAAFLAAYPRLREAARVRLNGLYREEDYPAPGSMPARFAVALSILPFPDSDDFRVTLATAETEAVRRGIDSDAQAAVTRATHDLFERLRSHMERMAERLAAVTVQKDGSKAPGLFRDTLIENLRGLCELLPRLNVTDDPLLTGAIEHAREQLLARFPDPEALRTGQRVAADGTFTPTGARAEALAEVKHILALLPPRGGAGGAGKPAPRLGASE